MQTQDGRIVYSATDLNNFLACRYLTALDADALVHALPRPQASFDARNLFGELGEKHEHRYLASLRNQGFDVAEIRREATLEEAAEATIAAMGEGRDVIYQATFLEGDWMGRADFLRRVPNAEGVSGRWAWHYEVEDTKLARHTQAYFLLQLCYYSEHVARIAGVVPEYVYVVLGDGLRHAFRHDDFAAYYRAVKAAFVEHVREPKPSLYPLPVPHCDLCDWSQECRRRWRADDHLTLVANITRQQIARLNSGGVTTLEQLATASEDVRGKIERATFEKLQRQARLQRAQREADASGGAPVAPEFLPHDEADWLRKGFALLPQPCEHDLYFDMEGDPYYDLSASLEYLFGVYAADDDAYVAFWGCDRSERPVHDRLAEKRAFEAFIDFVVERRRTYPDLHVYHYAAYEKTKLQELSLRHATREDEVDELLRDGVLVDLYTVVRQSIAVGQPSYSIKNLELYFGKRGEAGVKSGDQSILQFEQWIAGRNDVSSRDDALLADLEKYNEFDCISTHKLHGWLLELRERCREAGHDIPWCTGRADDAKPERADTYQEIKDALRARIPAEFDPEDGDADPQARQFWLALAMLEYHWREKKPVLWQFHDRCATFAEDPGDLLDDGETLVGLEFVRSAPEKRSVLETYRAPQQEFKAGEGDVYAPISKARIGTLFEVEETDEHIVVTIKRGPSVATLEMDRGIVVRKDFGDDKIRAAIARFAQALLDGDASRQYGASLDMLNRAVPRLTGAAVGTLQPKDPNPESIGDILARLDRSYLFVQGPPGSGKTYTGARLIAALIAKGARVGISANSHRAIHNILEELEEVAHAGGIALRGIKKVSENPESQYVSTRGFIENRTSFDGADANLFAGTAWAMCPAFTERQLDALFIDEAGQVSLPNALAISTAARNVVLLGDPLQLPHVSHTSHPGNVGVSVLRHLLGEELRPVQADRGVLLTSTYRMNAPICSYISSMMYEDRLHPAPGRNLQRVTSPGIAGQGLRFVAVPHANNRQKSEEEAAVIADEAARLLEGTLTDYRGQTRALVASDIIVVTPYNAQVRCIRRALAARGGAVAEIAVGTVDKFQGREAHVVFFSTAASSIEDAPRGIAFLFDRNRLNVAISRARSIAVLVASPALLSAECRSVEEARSMNAVLSFVERTERA